MSILNHLIPKGIKTRKVANELSKLIDTTEVTSKKIIPTTISHTPTKPFEGSKTYFYRRPSKRISEMELDGIPKGERNQPFKEKIPVTRSFESPDIPTQTLYRTKDGDIWEMPVRRLMGIKNAESNKPFIETMDYLETADKPIIPELMTPLYLAAAKNYYAKFGIDLGKYSKEAAQEVENLRKTYRYYTESNELSTRARTGHIMGTYNGYRRPQTTKDWKDLTKFFTWNSLKKARKYMLYNGGKL